jgi:hypothetical protein
MQDAFGQRSSTTAPSPRRRGLVIVTDVGYCFDLYVSFDRTANYRAFPLAGFPQ